MIEALRAFSGMVFGGWPLAEARPLLRFVHVAAFVAWAGPAMGASWLVHVAAWERRRSPDDAELLRREHWVRRRFQLIVALEHLAFATLVVTGLMLMESVGWAYAGQSWVGWKLALVLVVFVPMEIADVLLSAWLGRAFGPDPEAGDDDAPGYARAARIQDLFLRATIPPVVIGIPAALYLAVVKPL